MFLNGLKCMILKETFLGCKGSISIFHNIFLTDTLANISLYFEERKKSVPQILNRYISKYLPKDLP